MKNESTDLLPTSSSDVRIHAMLVAVGNGATVRAGIAQVFRSKADYYASVSLQDRLFIARRAKQHSRPSKSGDAAGGRVNTSVSLAVARHEAVQQRIDQLSLSKGRTVRRCGSHV